MRLEFNEVKDDFETVKEYEDYLEFVEDLIERKLQKSAEDEINQLIRKYRVEKN